MRIIKIYSFLMTVDRRSGPGRAKEKEYAKFENTLGAKIKLIGVKTNKIRLMSCNGFFVDGRSESAR